MFDRKIILVFEGRSMMIALPGAVKWHRKGIWFTILVEKLFYFGGGRVIALQNFRNLFLGALTVGFCLSSTSITMYVQKLTSASQYLYHFGVGLDQP